MHGRAPSDDHEQQLLDALVHFKRRQLLKLAKILRDLNRPDTPPHARQRAHERGADHAWGRDACALDLCVSAKL
jgi:hypothetical protein